MPNTEKPSFKTSVGGQALLEGVMMKGPGRWAMAVRRPDGTIAVEGEVLRPTPGWQKIPVIRGLFTFGGSLALGYKCLMRSADLSMDEAAPEEAMKAAASADNGMPTTPISAEPTPAAEVPAPAPTESAVPLQAEKISAPATGAVPGETTPAPAPGKPAPEKKPASLSESAAGVFSALAGVALALGLFLVLPTALVGLINRFVPLGGLRTPLEGVLKLVIFVAYVALCSLVKDIYRLFSYHGAEHKTIACYEAGEALTVENVRRHTRFHPRCGTSFLLVVMVVSIAIFSFIPWHSTLGRVGLKLLFLPLVMGLSYEVIRYTGRHDGAFSRAVAAPGLWMQRLTTHEPDDSMIEVAIAAVTPVLPEKPGDAPW